ncbi:inner membrane CreD family protein [Anaeromyxobacter oryzae]|uniref:Inner membrane protein n=1 Tax=Anaeromyxobacter oryzae TaxID=2918170 RepID=A0ABM7WVT2_9BACT|nr:inner membrane CreD family protein [Anaeromyxobacter oryzae]BDG03616.1 hypothetical protein AMOR_26120 [Anaeromyxobacter oryzae]
MRRLLAIGFIWFCCSAAWVILGSTLAFRSGATEGGLKSEVHTLWGPPLEQAPPSAVGVEKHRARTREQRFDEKTKRYFEVEKEEDVTTTRSLPLDASDVRVRLALEHRRKGLLWFPTYGVEFTGRYTFRNDSAEARAVELAFPVTAGVIYDGFAVTGADGAPVEVAFDASFARFSRRLEAGAAETFTVAYRTRGTERWGYGVAGQGLGPESGRARNFALAVETDFREVDFPAGTLSPSSHRRTPGGWEGTWRFGQIVGTAPVGIELPRRLNPGPLAAKITFFAPISLLFFFFVVGILLAARRRSIHPVNYFLLACGFFAFHLLFAYTIDHAEVAPAFALAAVVSVALVVSYARLFVGWRLALGEVGVAQLLYLVLFSVSFFWSGFTGLAITVGAILTLFVIMQLTGRLEWGKVLGRDDRAPAPPPMPPPLAPAP